MAGSDDNEARRVSRSVLAEQVKEWLMSRILDGTYQTDARIVETTVAKQLGVSQAPVREALRSLEAVGLIEITPFQGARVRRVDSAEILEAYAVRSAIETLGARLAMPKLTDDDVAQIQAQGARLLRAGTQQDPHQLAVEDAKFHEMLIQLSGNRTLVRVWRSLEPLSRTFLTVAWPDRDSDWTARLHTPILDALSARDPGQVVAAIEDHFAQAQASLMERHADPAQEPTTN